MSAGSLLVSCVGSVTFAPWSSQLEILSMSSTAASSWLKSTRVLKWSLQLSIPVIPSKFKNSNRVPIR